MNKLESQIVAGQLEALGWTRAVDPHDALLIVLNTCTVREKAQRKALSIAAQFRQQAKKCASKRLIGVMGCVGEQMGSELLAQPYDVDFVLGIGGTSHVAEVVSRVDAGEKAVLRTGWEGSQCSEYDAASLVRPEGRSAFVAVSWGCSNMCTYCIVPYVKGPIRYRQMESILREVRYLVERGYVEISLLGQSVNNYEHGSLRFHHLLERAAQTPGLKRLKFITTNAKDLDLETVKLMAHPPLLPYVSMPLQSGSDRILKRMNRGYTRREYLERADWLREIVCDVAISTDIMVGFPGETEEDFEGTLEVVRKVKFENVYSFIFSPRPGTPAARMPEQIPLKSKKARLDRLIALQIQRH